MKTLIDSIWILKTNLEYMNHKIIKFTDEQSIICDSKRSGTYTIENDKLNINFIEYQFEGYLVDECIFGYISDNKKTMKIECEYECKSYMSDAGEILNFEIPQEDDKVAFLTYKIYQIIKDYRVEYADNSRITKSRIQNWINQFKDEDKVLILEELRNIFSKRYLAKKDVLKYWDDILTKLYQKYQFQDIKNFLLNCCFIKTQPKGKSQHALLEILASFIKEKYNISIDECGSASKKYSIYVDDVLCTGLTFKNDIKKWAEEYFSEGKTNYKAISDGSTILICCYIFIHNKNYYKKLKEMEYANLGKIADSISAWAIWIDNSIKNDSKLEVLIPIQDLSNAKIIAYENDIKSKVDAYANRKGYTTKDEFYRNTDMPPKEEFFTSDVNRNKIEYVFLEKGIYILENSNVNNDNMRALGYSIPSHKNFGFGALCFTWRSVPNNTPLVFWYNGGGFLPLFDVRKDKEIDLQNNVYKF